ncbi:SPOR domain-containing protein [Neotabrizicola sp. VNH66]|uniref:SPOR domain-containing protein n=1 Tax=Neotabrizicola sp. VNH66 TaxID=3400918 RepID=UPI003C002F58
MADADYGEFHAYGAAQPAPGRGQRLINMAGAAGSVALVATLAWWGWDVAVRDARGVPIIRAAEGPMRIAPVEPGGEVVDHQGLAVNDVAAEGSAAPPPERLVLAPAPVVLSLEDSAGLAAAVPLEITETSTRLDSGVALPPEVPQGPVAVDGGQDDAVAAALAMALGDDAAGTDLAGDLGADEARAEDVVETAALDDQGLPPPEGAITRSPRPMPRPGAGRAAAPATESAVRVAVREVDPATLAPGTRLVQFGAFDTPEDARREWQRLAATLPALMEGKGMVIQSAESGGRTFWRLRGEGFVDESDSRRFCAAVKAEGPKCIPVAHR